MWGSNPSLLRQRVLSNFQSSAVAAKSLQSYSTLCIPMDSNPPGSSVHWILQTRMLEWVAIPFSRGSFWPRDWTQVSCTAGRFFTSWATREVGGIYVNTVCQPLLPAWLWGFLMCSLGCFLEEIQNHIAADSVYPWGEVSSGFFYITILNENL